MDKLKADQIKSLCKRLRLDGEAFVERAFKIETATNIDFLVELLSEEVNERERKRRNVYLKAAKFDLIKTFEDYVFDDIKIPDTINQEYIKNVSFIKKKQNLVLYGTVGAGKTHLAVATGIEACKVGFKTRFYRTATLVNELVQAQSEGTLLKYMKYIQSLDLLICDEWGYVPLDSNGTKLLFQVISECYEKKSLIITTNLEFEKWNDIFADKKITIALLDRIIHHSYMIDFTSRKSRRLKAATEK